VLAEFHKRVHDLTIELFPRFAEIRNKRAAVVIGTHEPTDEESDLPLIHDATPEELMELEKNAVESSPSKGVPNFWLYVLLNTNELDGMIYSHDVAALEHLQDISLDYHSQGYTLSFHFSENPFFTNAVLKKNYVMSLVPDSKDPFSYEGPNIMSSVGEPINWREGKNLTAGEGRKRDAEGQLISKEPHLTFFNYFSTKVKKLNADTEELAGNIAVVDFEIGETFRHKILPRAVLYFTDEADQGDDSDFDDEGGDFIVSDSDVVITDVTDEPEEMGN